MLIVKNLCAQKPIVEWLTEKRFLFLFIYLFFRLNHAFIIYLLLIEILLRWRSESTWEAFSLNDKHGYTNGLRWALTEIAVEIN